MMNCINAMHMQIDLIDMFSGAGLFSAGAVANGMKPVLAIDLSKEAVTSYNRNIAAVAVVGSVSDWPGIPIADVLIAGPPCQGFSTLGRQDPLDARNDLALVVPVWAERCQASVVVVENVPPFLRSPQWQLLADAFRDRGYELDSWELDAVDFGAPQLRRRSFTIASRIGMPSRPLVANERLVARDVLAQPVPRNDPMHVWPTPRGVAKQRIALIPPRGDKRDIMRLAPELCPPSWARVGCQATDVWGRIDPDQPSNTLRCTFQNPSKGRYLHPTENRTLSLREGARLQGVPDDWTFEGRPYPVARQIGNGVPIQLASAVMSSVAAVVASRKLSKAA